MKKNIFLFLILFQVYSISYSQTFESRFGKIDPLEAITAVAELDSNYYSFGIEYFQGSQKLISVSKLTSSGKLIASKEIILPDYLVIHDAIGSDSSILLIGVIAKDNEPVAQHVFILSINPMLEATYHDAGYRCDDQKYFMKIKRKPDGNFLLSGFMRTDSKRRHLIEINSNGEVLTAPNSQSLSYGASTGDFFVDGDTVYSSLVTIYGTPFVANKLILTKSNLHGDIFKADTLNVFSHTYPFLYTKRSDGLFELYGTAIKDSFLFKMIINRNHKVVSYKTIPIDRDYQKYGNTTIKVGEKIYFGGETDYQFLVSEVDTSFMTVKNIIVTEDYGIACDMINTSDNHLLVGGTMLDDYELIKADYQGYYTNVYHVLRKKVVVYPNPATHNLTIESSQHFTLIEVKDILGRVLITLDHPSENQINISKLNKGLYFLSAYTKEREVYNATFVKE